MRRSALLFAGLLGLVLGVSACGETQTSAGDGDTEEHETDVLEVAEIEEEAENFLVNGEVAYPMTCRLDSYNFSYSTSTQGENPDGISNYSLYLYIARETLYTSPNQSIDTWVYTLTERTWNFGMIFDSRYESFHTIGTLSDAAYAELLRSITSRFPPGCYDIGQIGDCCDLTVRGVSFWDLKMNQRYQIRWADPIFTFDTSSLKPDDRLCPDSSILADDVLLDYELTNLGDITRFILKSDNSYTFDNAAKQASGTLSEEQKRVLFGLIPRSGQDFPFSCVETIDPLLCQGDTRGHLYYRDPHRSERPAGGRFECLASASARFQSEYAETVTKLNAFLTRLVQ